MPDNQPEQRCSGRDFSGERGEMGAVTMRWSRAGSQVAVASDARSSVAIAEEQDPAVAMSARGIAVTPDDTVSPPDPHCSGTGASAPLASVTGAAATGRWAVRSPSATGAEEDVLTEGSTNASTTKTTDAHLAHADESAYEDGEGLNGFGGRLFVSHASSDIDVAQEIVAICEERGIATWLAERDIRVGENYAAQIYNAVVASSHILVLMSPESVASHHVRREVNVAIDNGVAVLPLVVSQSTDVMNTLPSDWKYWLGVIQAIPFSSADAAVAELEALLAN